MPLSLTPLLAAAVAMFVFLISNNPIVSLIIGFVSWRALQHLVTHGGNIAANENVRNPLPNRSSDTTSNATPARENSTDRIASNDDGPPLLTDFIKSGRKFLNSNSADNVSDTQTDDESYADNILENKSGIRKLLPNSSSGNSRDEMHGTPQYMQQLAALDLRISLGEITDAEYDTLYDRILRGASHKKFIGQ